MQFGNLTLLERVITVYVYFCGFPTEHIEKLSVTIKTFKSHYFEIVLAGQVVQQMSKCLCNSLPELLNVFRCPVQHVHNLGH